MGDTTSPTLAGIDLHLTTRVPTCRPTDSVSEVRSRLEGSTYDAVSDVAVLTGPPDDARLVGLVPMIRLLTAAGDALVSDLLDDDPPAATPGSDTEPAAWKAARHGESSLAVVGEDGRFRGLVPPGRLLGALLRAHDSDFARLGGYLASSTSARHAVEEPLARRLWHRTPWLALGILGAGISAWLVALSEAQLATDVRVAFFIPGVVYMADAVGTQTEALVIRGLAVGAPMRTAFRLEGLTGPIAGLVFGALALPLIWLAFDSFELGLTVALALVAACGVATMVACALPWALDRSGRDPAFGSGPLGTVIQDLLSLAVYLAAAQVLLG